MFTSEDALRTIAADGGTGHVNAPSTMAQPVLAGDWDRWFTAGSQPVVSQDEADCFSTVVGRTDGMRGVDLACGTGQWTRQLAAWGIRVTGYDFSTEALRQARAAGTRGGLSYRRCDLVADAIPYELAPHSLDIVTCRHALAYLEPARLLTDVGRWLKPSGVFFAVLRVSEREERPDGFHRALTERQFAGLGTGWQRCEVRQLDRERRAIALSGYGQAATARVAWPMAL
ncbi:class I SAM-dependent methyltransferase [Streptomyces sp. NPDC048202]|uniref:class I SAM-dependent methyltransferase n=1 Tax=Streptomyces sp. NPDC048202 TaxID=3365514 RepID=UPI00371BE521